jgi:hypothetical protein
MRTLCRIAVIPRGGSLRGTGLRPAALGFCSFLLRADPASCAVVGASTAGGAGAIVGGLLGLMLADHVFRKYRFIR